MTHLIRSRKSILVSGFSCAVIDTGTKNFIQLIKTKRWDTHLSLFHFIFLMLNRDIFPSFTFDLTEHHILLFVYYRLCFLWLTAALCTGWQRSPLMLCDFSCLQHWGPWHHLWLSPWDFWLEQHPPHFRSLLLYVIFCISFFGEPGSTWCPPGALGFPIPFFPASIAKAWGIMYW